MIAKSRLFPLSLMLLWITPGYAVDAAFALGSSVGKVRSLVGANTGAMRANPPGTLDTSAYADLGITMIRNHDFYGPLDMPTLYPDFTKDPKQPSSYIFTQAVGKASDSVTGVSSDSVYGAILSGGFEPYFRLGDSYNNVKPPANDSERANWAAAAVEILHHYRDGQWSGFQNSFRFVEIGNEPDNGTFWPKPATPEDYYKLYGLTAKAVRAAFPALKIGGPAVTHNGCTTASGKAWVSGFLDYVKNNAVPIDFFSWHIYSNDPAAIAACAQYYRGVLDGRGLTSVESHLTEWNTDARGASSADAVALRANGRGAAIDTASWIRMQESRVDQALFYRASDPAGASPEFYGLIDGSYAYKKPALAFKLWRMAAGYTQRLSTTLAAGSATNLTAMGAANGGGGYAFLLANTGGTARTWSLTLPNGTTLDQWVVTLYTVSDALDAHQISSPAGDVVIPAESMQLALLTPLGTGFNATASTSGSASQLTLTAHLKPANADQGKSGKVYVGAIVSDGWYLLRTGGWQAWSSGALSVYASLILPSSLDIPLSSGGDVRAYGGVPLYVGYGLSESDMLNRGLYRLVYTLPAR